MNHHLHLYYLQILLLLYAVMPVLRAFVRGAQERERRYALCVWFALGIALPLLQKYYPVKWFGGITPQYAINMTWSAAGYALLGWEMSLGGRRTGVRDCAVIFACGFAVTMGGTVAASLLTGAPVLDFMEGMSPGPALMAYGAFGVVSGLCSGRESSPQLAKLVKASFCIYLIHHFFIMVFMHVGFDAMLFAPIAEIPIEAAVVFAGSLAGWWLLSKIPFVKDHLI